MIFEWRFFDNNDNQRMMMMCSEYAMKKGYEKVYMKMINEGMIDMEKMNCLMKSNMMLAITRTKIMNDNSRGVLEKILDDYQSVRGIGENRKLRHLYLLQKRYVLNGFVNLCVYSEDMGVIDYYKNHKNIKGFLDIDGYCFILKKGLEECCRVGNCNEKIVRQLLKRYIDETVNNKFEFRIKELFFQFYVSCGCDDIEFSKSLFCRIINRNIADEMKTDNVYILRGRIVFLFKSLKLACVRGNLDLVRLIFTHTFFTKFESRLIDEFIEGKIEGNPFRKFNFAEMFVSIVAECLKRDKNNALKMIIERYKQFNIVKLFTHIPWLRYVEKKITKEFIPKWVECLIQLGFTPSLLLLSLACKKMSSKMKTFAHYLIDNFEDFDFALVDENDSMNIYDHMIKCNDHGLLLKLRSKKNFDQSLSKLIHYESDYSYHEISDFFSDKYGLRGCRKGKTMDISNYKFRKAVKDNKRIIVKFMLENTNVNPCCNNNYAILMCCRKIAKLEIVKLLVNHPKVNPASENNWPLRSACKFGHDEIVKVLLHHSKVDPNESKYGHNALYEAVTHDHVSTVKILLNSNKLFKETIEKVSRVVSHYGNEKIKDLLKEKLKEF